MRIFLYSKPVLENRLLTCFSVWDEKLNKILIFYIEPTLLSVIYSLRHSNYRNISKTEKPIFRKKNRSY